MLFCRNSCCLHLENSVVLDVKQGVGQKAQALPLKLPNDTLHLRRCKMDVDTQLPNWLQLLFPVHLHQLCAPRASESDFCHMKHQAQRLQVKKPLFVSMSDAVHPSYTFTYRCSGLRPLCAVAEKALSAKMDCSMDLPPSPVFLWKRNVKRFYKLPRTCRSQVSHDIFARLLEPGSPIGWSSLRSGSGPPFGICRAREHVPQTNAICTHVNRSESIQ